MEGGRLSTFSERDAKSAEARVAKVDALVDDSAQAADGLRIVRH